MAHSYYKFERRQAVTTTVEKHGKSEGSTGRVISRRGIKGCPQYLVKLDGKAGPCHFEELELQVDSNFLNRTNLSTKQRSTK